MHERTQIILCRAVFMAACVAPTLVTLLWAGSLCLPSHRHEQERQLSQLLGLRITVAEVSQPRPGVTVYRGLKAIEPELGFPIGEIARLEAREDREGLLVVATKADVTSEGLAPLWQLLARRLQSTSAGKTRLLLEEVVCHAPGAKQTLKELDALVEPTPTGVQAALGCAAAGDDAADRVRFRIVRNRQTTPPTATWELVTGATPLPCALVAGMAPGMADLGPVARFRGSIWVTLDTQSAARGQSTGQMTGEFSDVDLASLLQQRLPHTASGDARVLVHHARIDQGRIEEVTVSLLAGPGAIERRLLAMLAERLGFAPGRSLAELPDKVDYRQLGLAFRINGQGLAIRGICDGEPAGTVLTAPGGTLLREPSATMQPLGQLVQLFIDPATLHNGGTAVPLAAETAYLAGILPLPTTETAQARTKRE